MQLTPGEPHEDDDDFDRSREEDSYFSDSGPPGRESRFYSEVERDPGNWAPSDYVQHVPGRRRRPKVHVVAHWMILSICAAGALTAVGASVAGLMSAPALITSLLSVAGVLAVAFRTGRRGPD